MFCVSLFFFLQHCPTKWKEFLGVLGRVCQVKGTFFKATETFVNRKVKNDLWIQMIKKYFQEITDHSYFLHHRGQIRKQTTYLIVVVLKLACASESLGNQPLSFSDSGSLGYSLRIFILTSSQIMAVILLVCGSYF